MNQPPDRPRPGLEPPATPDSPSAVQEDVRATKRRFRTHRPAGRAVTLVVLLAVVVPVYLVKRGQDDPFVTGHPRPAAVAPPSVGHPLPTLGPRPRDPLLQQRWTAADDVYPMDLRGLTFSFRAPGSWGCRVSALAGVRWVCVDETGLLGGTPPAHPSSAMVQSDECKAPCAAKDYANVLSRLHALSLDTAGLHLVDSRTRVGDSVDPGNPALRFYRMSRTYDSDGDGTLDRHLWVQIEVDTANRIAAQKMLGDLYDATR